MVVMMVGDTSARGPSRELHSGQHGQGRATRAPARALFISRPRAAASARLKPRDGPEGSRPVGPPQVRFARRSFLASLLVAVIRRGLERPLGPARPGPAFQVAQRDVPLVPRLGSPLWKPPSEAPPTPRNPQRGEPIPPCRSPRFALAARGPWGTSRGPRAPAQGSALTPFASSSHSSRPALPSAPLGLPVVDVARMSAPRTPGRLSAASPAGRSAPRYARAPRSNGGVTATATTAPHTPTSSPAPSPAAAPWRSFQGAPRSGSTRVRRLCGQPGPSLSPTEALIRGSTTSAVSAASSSTRSTSSRASLPAASSSSARSSSAIAPAQSALRGRNARGVTRTSSLPWTPPLAANATTPLRARAPRATDG